MRNLESIYPLQDIFTRFLEHAEKKCFLIPAYQRGYKWTSKDGKGQVNILLRDLLKAFELKNEAYYLQFLTLKNNGEELEVIDGQQRLTTLTILYSIIFELLDNRENFVRDKLNYQIRQNFLKKFIYNDIGKLLQIERWEDFCIENPDFNNQDTYYIYHAAKTIQIFLKNTIRERLEDFALYLNRKVFLIINPLPDGLNSEKIFVNVNKGVKLGDVDLVKGMLITKLPKDISDYKVRKTETEINESRIALGRQWDEISNWSSQESIMSFYNETESKERMSWLMAQIFSEVDIEEGEHPIFEYLDAKYSNKELTAIQIFEQIKKMKMTLNDWYLIPEIHNLVGLFLRNEGKKYVLKASEIDRLMKLPKSDVLKTVKNYCLEILPIQSDTNELEELSFEDDKHKIFNLFLMLDVAKFLPIGNQKVSLYNFSNISDEKWSIEHIFPQKAKDFKRLEVLSVDDLNFLREILPKKEDDIRSENPEYDLAIKALYQKLTTLNVSSKLTPLELKTLEELLAGNGTTLHTIGNLALLPNSINSGLSNHYFNEKRKRLVKRIGNGDFVPFHTYDVFSKLIFSNNTKLNIWSKDDIEAHESYIKTRISDIINYLKS